MNKIKIIHKFENVQRGNIRRKIKYTKKITK